MTKERILWIASSLFVENRRLAQWLSARAIGAVGLRVDSQVGQIETVRPMTRHHCDVSSELYCTELYH